MTALIDPTRHGAPRHRRVVEDPTDDVGLPVRDGWLDPETAPLAVYRDRDLPYAPLAVQRDRAAAAAAVVPVVPAAVGPAVAAAVVPAAVVRAPVVRAAVPVTAVVPPGGPSALVDRLGRARVAAVAVLALVVVLAAVALVVLGGGPPDGRPGPGGAPTGSAHVLRTP